MIAPVVCKIGTSSLTDDAGVIDQRMVEKLCAEVADLRSTGIPVVIVTSGAIAAGLPQLDFPDGRPRNVTTLQAVSAVGQISLMSSYQQHLAGHGLRAGQVLLAPLDFMVRSQYLHARNTLLRLLELGVVPVVNENDAIADEEIRYGDNDRIAALVSHHVDASTLVLLTDTPGLFTADPRHDASASLIEEIIEIDQQLELAAGGAGTARGSGGMASKLAAAKMASWSGVRTVIADAGRSGVLRAAVDGDPGVGTTFAPRAQRLGARKLWIAFAVASSGYITVDGGARRALIEGAASLLPAGVVGAEGAFVGGDAVEVRDSAGITFAKGLVRYDAVRLNDVHGRRSAELPDDLPAEVIHRDDLVMLP